MLAWSGTPNMPCGMTVYHVLASRQIPGCNGRRAANTALRGQPRMTKRGSSPVCRVCAERTLFRRLFVAPLEVLPPAGEILLLLDRLALRVVERRRPGTAGAGSGVGLSGHAEKTLAESRRRAVRRR